MRSPHQRPARLRLELRSLLRRGEIEQELEEEFTFHLEMQVAEYQRSGLPEEEARRRAAGFSGTVVLTLALGLGGTTAVFCAMDRLLLRPLPNLEPERLVAAHETQKGTGYRPVSLANLMDWRVQSRSFEGMAGYMTRTFSLRGGGCSRNRRRWLAPR